MLKQPLTLNYPLYAPKKYWDQITKTSTYFLDYYEFNIKHKVEKNTYGIKKFMLKLRRKMAYKYYLSMKCYGFPIFWLLKNKDGTVHFSKLEGLK